MPEVTDIERDLAALLAVDPSPAFAAGVRARIAAAPPRTIPGWTWVAAAAALILAVAAAGITLRDPRPGVDVVSNGTTPHVAPPEIRPGEAAPATRTPVQHGSKVRRVRGAAGRPRVNEAGPLVIVDPAFQRAVRQLAHAARYSAASYVVATGPADTAPAAELQVTPMTVGALAVPEITVSDPQSGARR